MSSIQYFHLQYNLQLLRLAGENGVAAYGVVMYVAFLFSSIIIGYDIGSNPLFAYNHGAENHTELRNLFRKSLVLISGGGMILCVAAVSLSYPLAYLFVGYNAALTELAQYAFCVFSVYFVLHGYNIFASGLFTALNNGLISALIAFSRTFLFQSAAVILLPLLFGATGIWWSAAVSEILALLVSAFFILRYRRQYGYL